MYDAYNIHTLLFFFVNSKGICQVYMMLMYKSSTKEESRVLILVVYLSLFRLCMPLPFSISSVRRCPFHQHKFIVPANSPLYFCYVLVYCFGEQI